MVLPVLSFQLFSQTFFKKNRMIWSRGEKFTFSAMCATFAGESTDRKGSDLHSRPVGDPAL